MSAGPPLRSAPAAVIQQKWGYCPARQPRQGRALPHGFGKFPPVCRNTAWHRRVRVAFVSAWLCVLWKVLEGRGVPFPTGLMERSCSRPRTRQHCPLVWGQQGVYSSDRIVELKNQSACRGQSILILQVWLSGSGTWKGLSQGRAGQGPVSPTQQPGSSLSPEHPACSFLLQKKKGKETGSGAALPPPRVPALPPEARAPHAGPLATAKRSKAKAKGKEAKKEVSLPGGWEQAEDRAWARPQCGCSPGVPRVALCTPAAGVGIETRGSSTRRSVFTLTAAKARQAT